MERSKYILIVFGLLSITSALAQDFTLDIFGNANEDELIDEEDVSYIQEVLNSEKEETALADANQDGKVDQADIDRVREIIEGTESELYYINVNGDVARVKHPLDRIVVVYDNNAEIIRILVPEH